MADDNQKPGGGDAPPSWAAGLDAEHQEFIGKRGWDKVDANAAAVELAKAYRGSEKLRGGMAAGDVVALPKPGPDGTVDPAVARAFWEKVGAPKDATGYQFDGLTKKDGTALDAAYTDAARQAAASVNMPAHMLQGFLAGLQPHFDGAAEAQQARRSVDIEANRRDLAAEWGANEARNKFIAARAADTLKLAPETIAAMETLPGVGYKGIMKMMLQLGEQMGEARFVPGSVGGTITGDQAQAWLDAKGQDSAWQARWVAGGAQEKEDFSKYAKIAHAARNAR